MFFFRKLLFLTSNSSNSKVYYAIALKFSAKQINLITKKSMSAICDIMNIYAEFKIFYKTNKIKINFFFKNSRPTFVENVCDLNMCQNSELLKRVRDVIKELSQMNRRDKYSQHSSIIYKKKLLMFCEIGASENYFLN